MAVLGVLIFLYLLITLSGRYSRRHLLGDKRKRLLQNAFTDFCYQPFADPIDLVGITNIPEFADKFKSSFSLSFLSHEPEIYNLIDDQRGNSHRSVFDLRVVSSKVVTGGSTVHTFSVFLLNLPDYSLTAFELGREGLANLVLWGEDPDIDIEGEFIFSQTFHLTGPDRAAVITLFDKELVSFFRTNTLLFSSGRLYVRQNAILFQHAEKLSPEEIRSTLCILSKLIELCAQRQRGH